MLQLMLVRHAQAEPAYSGRDDWDRDLEARGRRDAVAMGQRLRSRQSKPDRILSSPAVRALATATIMARELGVADIVQQDERLYLAAAKDLMTTIRELGGEARRLMAVGHNPGISEFADKLSGERSIDNLPTCAVYSLAFDIARWHDLEWSTGVDADFDYPGRSG